MKNTFGKALALVIVTLVLFIRVLFFEFAQLDDTSHLDNNPYFKPVSIENTLKLWTHSHLIYMPVTWTVWSAIAAVSEKQPEELTQTVTQVASTFRFEPFLFHAANLLFHVASVLLVFFLLIRFLGNETGAFVGALVFAMHPIQVESVAWVSAFKDVLSTFFALLALWAYARKKGDANRNLWMAFAFFLLATLSKPSRVTLPAAFFVISVFFEGESWKDALKKLWPFFVAVIPFVFLAVDADPEKGAQLTPAPLFLRPVVALDTIGFYFEKLLLPFSLILDYGRNPVRILNDGDFWLTGLLGCLAVGGAYWWSRRKEDNTPLAAMALFLVLLFPTLGLITFVHQTVSTVADRYLYAPMFAVSLLVGWIVREYVDSGRSKQVVQVSLAALFLISCNQVGYWTDGVTTLSHVVAVNPNSWLAHNNLGSAYERLEKLDLASQHYRKAGELNPSPLMFNNVGAIELVRGKKDEALWAYGRALQLAPDNAINQYSMGLVYLRTGEPGRAVPYLQQALKLDPNFVPARQAMQSLMPPTQIAQKK